MGSPKQIDLIVLSHWAKLFSSAQYSPLEFYEAVLAKALPKEIPKMGSCRVEWDERSFVSDRRQYLAVGYEDLTAYVCAAPFGTGFFVSHRITRPIDSTPWAIIFIIGFLVIIFALLILEAGFGWNYWLHYLKIFGILVGYFMLVGVVLKCREVITYFKIDCYHMFCQAIHSAVMEAVDEMTSKTGIAPLSMDERKSMLGDLLK